MKLYLLRPIENIPDDPWIPWFGRCFGFVIRAESEARARRIAQENSGEESGEWYLKENDPEKKTPWLRSDQSTCTELTSNGPEEMIINDFKDA